MRASSAKSPPLSLGSAETTTALLLAFGGNISGGAGQDVLRGGRGADLFEGGGGADELRGLVGAEYCVVAGQAAFWYSLMRSWQRVDFATRR